MSLSELEVQVTKLIIDTLNLESAARVRGSRTGWGAEAGAADSALCNNESIATASAWTRPEHDGEEEGGDAVVDAPADECAGDHEHDEDAAVVDDIGYRAAEEHGRASHGQ